MLLGQGVPRSMGRKGGAPLKRHYFTAIDLSSMKMIADRHRHAAYHNKHWQRAS